MRKEILENSVLVGGTKWLQLRELTMKSRNIFGYSFSHEIRCQGAIIVIAPFKQFEGKTMWLSRVEATPCWDLDRPIRSSLTGGVDLGTEPLYNARKELMEESGYDVDMDDIIELGTSYGTKSTDTIYHLYTVDLTGVEQTKDLEAESKLEGSAYCEWLTEEQYLASMDPFCAQAWARARAHVGKKRAPKSDSKVMTQGANLTQEELDRYVRTVAVDFDGPIHSFKNGWQDGTIYDEPAPGARESLQALKDEGKIIVIHTARIMGTGATIDESQVEAVREYLNKHKIPYDAIVPKIAAIAYVDDRAVMCDPANDLDLTWQSALERIKAL